MAKNAARASAELDRLTDALYAAPPEAFVAERKRLAAALKSEGDSAGAAALAKAPKPTLSAWVINQLARVERGLIQRLADASARVRKSQLALMRAGGSDARASFTAASAEQRETLAALRAAAERLLKEGGHAATPAVLERVSRNLRAMVTSDETAALIEAGRLAADLPPQGFADFGDFAAIAAGAAGHHHTPAKAAKAAPIPAAPPRAKPASKKEEAAARRRAEAEARAREKAQAHERAARARELARRRKAAEAAAAHARTLAAAAARARKTADAAEEAARRAQATADEAARAVDDLP